MSMCLHHVLLVLLSLLCSHTHAHTHTHTHTHESDSEFAEMYDAEDFVCGVSGGEEEEGVDQDDLDTRETLIPIPRDISSAYCHCRPLRPLLPSFHCM